MNKNKFLSSAIFGFSVGFVLMIFLGILYWDSKRLSCENKCLRAGHLESRSGHNECFCVVDGKAVKL